MALSASLYILESFVPFPIPFGRWGFSNSVVLFSAVNWGLRSTLTVAAIKSIVGSSVVGTLLTPTFFMGFLGSTSAGFSEWVLSRFGFGYVGLSVAGSIANNLVQVVVGAFLIKSFAIFSVLPLFLSLGMISAVANAYIAKSMERVWRERG